MSKSSFLIGHRIDDKKGEVRIDVEGLAVSRMLLTGSSGSGKSWMMRVCLESLSAIQQTIVIDPEGEFGTLREKRDMVLVGPDGDLPADPFTAGLLARKLMELRVSAVIDIQELTPKNRRIFVTSFFRTMVDLPRGLWHPCAFAIDELHDFAPSQKQDDSDRDDNSGQALASFISKARKRSFGFIGATQRLSKLSLDIAAELKNRLIGNTIQDVDQKRAADYLGFKKDRWTELRDLSSPGNEGEWFGVGPAFNDRGVIKFRSIKVETTHVRPGKGKIPKPPAPSKTIEGIVGEMSDLAKERREEIKSLDAAKKRIFELEQAERRAASGKSPASIKSTGTTDTRAVAVLRAALTKAQELMSQLVETAKIPDVDEALVDTAISAMRRQLVESLNKSRSRQGVELERVKVKVRKAIADLSELLGESAPTLKKVAAKADKPSQDVSVTSNQITQAIAATGEDNGHEKLKGEDRVLAAIWDEELSRTDISAIAAIVPTSRNTYISRLASAGKVDADGDKISITDEGRASLSDRYRPLPRGSALLAWWLGRLPDAEAKILKTVVAAYPSTMKREDVREAVEFPATSCNTYISRLGGKFLLEMPAKSVVQASKLLFD